MTHLAFAGLLRNFVHGGLLTVLRFAKGWSNVAPMFLQQSCLRTWLKAILSCLVAWLLMAPAMVLASESASLPAWSQGYDPNRDPAADGREAIALARQSGRYVLIELGGDWCVWCRRLDRFLAENPDLRNRLHRQFVLLKVNVSEENDNAAFLAGLPRFAGYPH
ncbi:MAG TPA: thioredoxin family protein, partial [Gammaproteobacteria bacterium]|nr:thioredoxin family protein [Gammaproteobacteria bacterium]